MEDTGASTNESAPAAESAVAEDQPRVPACKDTESCFNKVGSFGCVCKRGYKREKGNCIPDPDHKEPATEMSTDNLPPVEEITDDDDDDVGSGSGSGDGEVPAPEEFLATADAMSTPAPDVAGDEVDEAANSQPSSGKDEL